MRTIEVSGFIFLVIMIVAFFLGREQLFKKRTSILTGFDLIIIVFISLSFILNGFIENKYPSFISVKLLQAFLFYMSYKVVVLIKPSYLKTLFYASFIIPMICLLVILLSQ
jgi:hypothetical protein